MVNKRGKRKARRKEQKYSSLQKTIAENGGHVIRGQGSFLVIGLQSKGGKGKKGG